MREKAQHILKAINQLRSAGLTDDQIPKDLIILLSQKSDDTFQKPIDLSHKLNACDHED